MYRCFLRRVFPQADKVVNICHFLVLLERKIVHSRVYCNTWQLHHNSNDLECTTAVISQLQKYKSNTNVIKRSDFKRKFTYVSGILHLKLIIILLMVEMHYNFKFKL